MNYALLNNCQMYRSKYSEDQPILDFTYDLTWKGHELLSMIRDDDVWAEIKFKLSGHECSLPILEELAKQIILNRIELQEHSNSLIQES